MCDPVTISIAGTALAAAGTVASGIQQSQQASYQAKVADVNARNAAEQARDAQERGALDLRSQYRRTAAIAGEQRAAMAANGIDLGFGSAMRVQEDTAMLGREDAMTIAENSRREVMGFDISASNLAAEAAAKRSQATGAIFSTIGQFGQTIAGGAQQLKGLKASRR